MPCLPCGTKRRGRLNYDAPNSACASGTRSSCAQQGILNKTRPSGDAKVTIVAVVIQTFIAERRSTIDDASLFGTLSQNIRVRK